MKNMLKILTAFLAAANQNDTKKIEELFAPNIRGKEFQKEVDLTEEEIESYSGCSERTQRCLNDCPWPFPGSYIK